MKRFFVGIFCTAVLAASMSALDAQVIYSIDFESNADIINSDPDTFRFTTFSANIGSNFAGQGTDLDGNMVNNATAFGNAVVAINHNQQFNPVTGNENGNQGTGFLYIPTNVAWEANTTYSIDLALINRTSDAAVMGNAGFDGATIEVGLFAGLPADHASNLIAFPNRQGAGPFAISYDAQTDPSLGTVGSALLDFEAGEGFRYISNDVNATQFGFTTGADVSGLGEMVLFVRNTLLNSRLHFDDIRVSASPATGLVGDFDGDGDVDCGDLDGYVLNIGEAASGALSALDIDGDGTLSAMDANTHITTLVQTSIGQVGTFPGDLNCDGTVNVLGDAFILVSGLGNSVTSYSAGDINFDGVVNVLGDAFVLVAQLGNSNEP
ncbi:hypothetical protein N9L06_03835 [Mariniblastus sp.]|nr:hypothetical protein [Mariniblastus sp.]